MGEPVRVVELWRFPMKSAGGERLDAAEITADGLVGDRRWACLDEDGVVVSAKQPRLWERLLRVTVAGGTVRLPDGRTAALAATDGAGGDTDAGALLSSWLGRRVTVTDVVPDGAVLHRFWPREPGMIPTWAAGAEAGSDVLSVIGSGRFHDFGAVHVVTTGALARLGEVHGAAVDHRRFRPNLLLDLPGDPAPGGVVEIGGVRLRVLVPTPRCVVPSLGHGGGAGDTGLLRTLARHYRMPVGDFGTAACFGWYATVERPGRVEAGQAGRIEIDG
ncbi:MOSC domain-containing protein [Dactylosporangium aurantiacum]|uniref:MOSC domain-containing protein n=1 Tax=Dactylosporangium aurantiacum TaxID=35754 RepID=A0A9Q9IB59_9ACTN|nr:MOSC N-terminal beta barrel domain-containing protein [Dactylosporangium aurantiacum]MDG6101338.1 MOSC domain-containing protein [Dactylosporangium aurantiacum]UWZ52802.1 MOSC domain-containing protein [Dactylosporangium aurantiacum]